MGERHAKFYVCDWCKWEALAERPDSLTGSDMPNTFRYVDHGECRSVQVLLCKWCATERQSAIAEVERLRREVGKSR